MTPSPLNKLTRLLPGGGGGGSTSSSVAGSATTSPVGSPRLMPEDKKSSTPAMSSAAGSTLADGQTSAAAAAAAATPPTLSSNASSCHPRIPSLRLPGRKSSAPTPPSPTSVAAIAATGNNIRQQDSTVTSPTDTLDGIERIVLPGTASSCQLFQFLKALAAGGGGVTFGTNSMDSDEEESVGEKAAATTEDAAATLAAASYQEITQSTHGLGLVHNLSSLTVKEEKEKDDDEKTVLGSPREIDVGDPVQRWLRDTVGPRNEAVSSQLAALSMSSFSPYAHQEMSENAPLRPNMKRMQSKPRPELPVFDDDDAVNDSPDELEDPELGPRSPPPEEEEGSPVLDDGRSSTTSTTDSTNLTTPDDQSLPGQGRDANSTWTREDIPDEEKLAVIVKEFGDVASLMVHADGTPGEPERLLAESKGSLFKGVMMIGNLHLTTHRLLFHALLPPDSAFVQQDPIPAQTEEAAAARAARPDILQAGPVTIHRGGLIKTKKRVWMELSPEMVTTYPSADEAGRVRPLVTLLLSTAHRLAPLDDENPCDFFVTYDSSDGVRTTHFTVDTEQSAVAWRRQFEGVMFRHARQRFRDAHRQNAIRLGQVDPEDKIATGEEWTMLRCCVPLDRAKINGLSEYHSFATLVSIDVALDEHEHITWHPERIAEGNFGAFTRESPEEGKTGNFTPTKVTPGGSGVSTPRRSFTLATALPFKRDKERILPGKLSSTPTHDSDDEFGQYMAKQPKRADSCYLDTSLPPRLANSPHRSSTEPTNQSWAKSAVEPDDNMFKFLVAVLNEQKWFAHSLEAATKAAHMRQFKPGVARPRVVLDVGGFDCLATDEDLEAEARATTPSSDTDPDDEDAGKPLALIETRKMEKAILAAKVFGLREDEGIWLKRCYVAHGLVPARGHIILTPRYLCFWRRGRVGADIKYRFSCGDVKGAEPGPGIRPGMHGLALKIHGQHDLRFEFWHEKSRDETISRINSLCKPITHKESIVPSTEPGTPILVGADLPVSASSDTASLSAASVTTTTTSNTAVSTASQSSNMSARDEALIANDLFQVNPALIKSGHHATLKHAADVLAPPKDQLFMPKALSEEALSYMPFIANRPWNGIRSVVRLSARRFTMLTIGSRGDVQPYIALALRLMQDGHTCVIVTHSEFKKWIEGYGIEHRQAGGDPTALMKLSQEHKMFSPGFFKESLGSFRQWLDDLLLDSWNACRDADVLIESPSAMAGVHIAEALKIPYFRAFTMPWTRTSSYPQAFMVPAFEMGPSFNYSTYVLFDNIMWRATAGQINRWRKVHLGLGSTDMSSLSVTKVPFLYNFSPAVVPKPLDWHDDITITGYWNLEDSDTEWIPPPSLEEFMSQAKADGKPLVYIGFGSIVVPRPNDMTRSIIKAVEKADVRAIVAKGWSSRGSDPKDSAPVEFPKNCYSLDKVPHSWLFPKVQAALHHGGAGTVGASLRAGIPTLIKPWFGDQHFWAIRVQKLEVGLKVASLRSDEIADALRKATTSRVMIEKAARIGERIRSESGVNAAIQAIHYNIIRAASDRTKMTWAK